MDWISASIETCVAGIPLIWNLVALGEMEETADVIVLIVRGKKTFDFAKVERERRERDGPAEFAGL